MNRIAAPKFPVAIVTGTTASGKTGLSIEFARSRPKGTPAIEIVNADSLLVYRGFNIGTAKPTLEERQGVPHHLLDIRDPTEPFTAGDFVREVDRALAEVHARGNRALIVGGTGFYLKALIFGLWDAPKPPAELRQKLDEFTSRELFDRLMKVDEKSALRITLNDRYRLIRALETVETTGKTPTELEAEAAARGTVPGLSLFITDRSPDDLRKRIALRARIMLEQGFLDEVKTLHAKFPGAKPFESVGYVEALAYLDGRKPSGRKIADGVEGLVSEIELATNQLAKRQRTFFKGQFIGHGASEEVVRFFTLEAERASLLESLSAIYT